MLEALYNGLREIEERQAANNDQLQRITFLRQMLEHNGDGIDDDTERFAEFLEKQAQKDNEFLDDDKSELMTLIKDAIAVEDEDKKASFFKKLQKKLSKK